MIAFGSIIFETYYLSSESGFMYRKCQDLVLSCSNLLSPATPDTQPEENHACRSLHWYLARPVPGKPGAPDFPAGK